MFVGAVLRELGEDLVMQVAASPEIEVVSVYKFLGEQIEEDRRWRCKRKTC